MAVIGHPRLWFTEPDLDRLRSWAIKTNPIYESGLKPLVDYAVQRMDQEPPNGPDGDNGSASYTPYPKEMHALLFAFMSLIGEPAARKEYAQRAHSLLMHIINAAEPGALENEPFRHPRFATYDRSRWHGLAFGLTVDWIYPYLKAEAQDDIKTIHRVFLRWCEENLHADVTDHNHPEPGKLNNPDLLHVNDPKDPGRRQLRFSANNYYLAHARNIGLMALAFDPVDDPDNSLRSYILNVTGAWLFVTDHLLREDAQGGLSPEGFQYGPTALGRLVQLLLALHTSGEDDPAVKQAVLAANPFWADTLSAFLHSLSPRTAEHPQLGQVYDIAAFGDQSYYALRDPIELFGPLGLYYEATEDHVRLATTRWIQIHAAPGGQEGLVNRVSRLEEAFHQAILYFMLLAPGAAPDDPRPAMPRVFLGKGLGRILARTGWDPDATWLTYKLSWNRIDHQHADGNLFELYRRGEWLTKEWTGYGVAIACSDYHNTLSLENDDPHADPGDHRYIAHQRGSQWLFASAGDPALIAHSITDDFLYVTGDATNLYNYPYQWDPAKSATDILHASRSLVWLKPDHVILYDRASSKTSERFKRFWLNAPSLPAAPSSVNGMKVTAIASASGKQTLYVTTVLPAEAVISHDDGKAEAGLTSDEVEDDLAPDEPMKYRLQVEAPGKPANVRFLHVLQSAGAQVKPSPVALVESTKGTPFAGVEVEGTLVLFRVDLQGDFTGVTFTRPTTVKRILITGLSPGAGYVVTEAGNSVTVAPDGPTVADQGGVLVLEKSTISKPSDAGDSGSGQPAWQPLTKQLNALEGSRRDIEANHLKAKEDIAQGQRALAEAGSRQSDLTVQMALLQKVRRDLEGNSQAVEKLRSAARATLSAAEQSQRKVLDQIATLPPARRKAFEDAITAVNKPIVDLDKKAKALRVEAAKAEADGGEAEKRAGEDRLRETLAQLLQLPGQIQAAQAQVTALVSAAEAAASKGRIGEALYLADELERAIDALKALISEAGEVTLIEGVVKQWQSTQTANRLRRELDAAERELEGRRQQRDHDIRAAIAAAEGPTPDTTALSLEGAVGKTIADFCGNGFTAPENNHCAHFVSHVLGLNVGYTCQIATGRGQPGGCLRVHELFERCPQVGEFAQAPTDSQVLVFVTERSNVDLAQRKMRNVPKKHVGIYNGGLVYHYSKAGQEVKRRTPAEFFSELQASYGGPQGLYFGTLPGSPMEPAASENVTVRTEPAPQGRLDYYATVNGGTEFYVGRDVLYPPSSVRYVGLYQPGSKLQGRRYVAEGYEALYGQVAAVLAVIAACEGAGYFNRLNTYDRAAFTFGFLQLAAHTPDDNLVLLFRRCVREVPEFRRLFPDLAVQDGRLHQVLEGGGLLNLEKEYPRPERPSEMNLRDFMAYLNPADDRIDDREVVNAAKLVWLCETSETFRDVQVNLCAEITMGKLRHWYDPWFNLDGASDLICTAICDIFHQGRGTKSEVQQILMSGGTGAQTLAALCKVGEAEYPARCETLRDELSRYEQTGALGRSVFDRASGLFRPMEGWPD